MSGYAKSIVVMTAALIIAGYSISMKGIQVRQVQTATAKAQVVQTEQIQNSVLMVALNQIATNGAVASNNYSNTVQMCGTAATYTIKSSSPYSARVTVETNYGEKKRMFARVDNYSAGNYIVHHGGWRVTNVFI